MRHVVLVAPHFLANTIRYIAAFVRLRGVHTSVVSEDPADALPAAVREPLGSHFRVHAALDASEIERAVRALAGAVGPVDRIAGALEQLQLPIALVRDAVGIEGMTAATARAFRDKDVMKQRLRDAGVPVARSRLCTSEDELRTFVDLVGYPIVVKPPAGLGSRATYRIESAEGLAALGRVGVAPSTSDPLQAEEFVRGREHTCETVTLRGTPVWRSGTRYFPTPLEVVQNPWIQYAVLLPREADDPTFRAFDTTNAAALAALGCRGAQGTALTHMEWFLRDDGSPVVSEVGARPPGVHIMPLMSLAHDFDAVGAWAELMALDTFTPRARVAAAGVAFFRAQGRGDRVREVLGWDEAHEAAGSAVVEVSLPRPGQPRASGYEGEGHAIVRCATTEEAKTALHALVHHVRVVAG